MHMILFLQGVVLKRFDKFTDHVKDEGYIRKKNQKKRQWHLDQTMVRRMSKEKRKERKKKERKEKKKRKKEKRKEKDKQNETF